MPRKSEYDLLCIVNDFVLNSATVAQHGLFVGSPGAKDLFEQYVQAEIRELYRESASNAENLELIAAALEVSSAVLAITAKQLRQMHALEQN